MGKVGYSFEEMAWELDVWVQTFYDWKKKYPEFNDAMKKASALSEGWWRKQARQNLKSRVFRDHLWFMNMKNRFGWADKTQQDGTSGGQPL